ncbi:MAG TPA: PilZ domain-containing protein [Limnobacter sp.]|nr:PilZ domain-containing protein [Limnobacter sp.]
MDNRKELSPLAKGEIELGKPLPFSIYDSQGVLLLAAGQTIATARQLDELASKGLYHNPRWAAGKTVIPPPNKGNSEPTISTRVVSPKQAFEDPFETGSQLKMFLPKQGTDPFQVRLIGTIPQLALVITHPMRDGKCVFVKEGQVWEFQATYELSIYRFTAMIDKVLLSPHPLVVMSWPHETHVESQVVRRTRRVNCELPATVRLSDEKPGSGEPIAAIIDNISTGGLELLFAKPISLNVGQPLSIAFQIVLEDRKYLIECDADVVAGPRDPAGVSSTYGVAIKGLSDEQFAVVHAYVGDHLIHRLGPRLYAKPYNGLTKV